jgi:hypothetical protein
MKHFHAAYEVYSPRWGHTDRYEVVLTQAEMRVTQGMNSAVCTRPDGNDPEWSGYGGTDRNPLMSMFSNDCIYAPEIVPRAMEWAWRRWRDEAVTDDELRSGLKELFAWIDQTARGRPAGILWNGAF